jgi:hypothetical protein
MYSFRIIKASFLITYFVYIYTLIQILYRYGGLHLYIYQSCTGIKTGLLA